MKIISVGLLASLVFTFDQFSKWYVLSILRLDDIKAMEIIPGFINFVMAWNRGINFGLFASGSLLSIIILTAFPVLISMGIVWWIIKSPRPFLCWGGALVIGGALGNALDRIVHGAVVDFLNVTAFGFHNPYSFNIADIAIFLGAFLIIWDIQYEPKKEEQSS